MSATEEDPARRTLDERATDQCRVGRLILPELRRRLGFDTRIERGGVLKARGIYMDYDEAHLIRDLCDIDHLGR
ncbi:hypothetical protein DK419_19660 [Methylobacterium terrae]|uniref:Uncharacterized protein n=1 Tax=Methylobacterium terrae TaxID=2202827 RepID=A0A2U8WSA4_9HYPH|nr:hypothetical protein [Methylobacterium terrae]AWN48290.1 hypothetical protein DK419_19660 [Methylobacterium terrae]